MTVDRPDLDAIRPGTLCPHCEASLEPPPEPHAHWCLVGELFVRLGAKDVELDRLRAERDHYRDAIREHRDGCRTTDVDVDPPHLTDECRRIHDYGQCAESDAALWEALDFGGVA